MAVIHGLVVSFGFLLADSQPVTSYNPTATLWVTCRHEKICICNTRCCKSIFVIYSPLTSVNTNYRVSKFNWKCLCWFRISISPLLLCYAKSTPVFSTAATRCSNIHTWYRNIINCICFTRTSIVANTRNCCKYIWKFEGKSYIWSTCIVSKSPLLLCFTDCNYRISKITTVYRPTANNLDVCVPFQRSSLYPLQSL